MTHTTNLNLNKPDRQDLVSVITDINDNMDIIDNAYDSLSDQIGTYDIGTNTLANIETALATYANTFANDQFKNVKFTISTTTGLFSATSYFGVLRKVSTGRYNISVQGLLEPTQTIYGNYRNSAWSWGNPFDQIADVATDCKMKSIYVASQKTITIALPLKTWQYITLIVLYNNNMYNVRVHFDSSQIYELYAYNTNDNTQTNIFSYNGKNITFTASQYSSLLMIGNMDSVTIS